MQQSSLLIVAMADQCRSMIQGATATVAGQPAALHPRHLLWMCDRIEKHVEEWPSTKLHRWIGFIQGGMLANGLLDLNTAKSMFNEAKKAHGVSEAGDDLLDHLDPTSDFEFDLGGES